jgi:hypothetical protein
MHTFTDNVFTFLNENIYAVFRDLIRNDCRRSIINAINVWWFMIGKSIDEI